MSKRDDEPSDMEVGMTTAERRRRRRRGGGLRVPSDNVPRRSSTPPVVAPVPEDPSLAMSIAYSFTSEASEPVPRVTIETPVPTFDTHEAMPTVIDSVSDPVEQQDFEMKTREMSAVDLEALGLQEPGSSNNVMTRPSMPGVDHHTPAVTTTASSAVEVRFKSPGRGDDDEVELDIDGGATLDTDSEPVLDNEATTIAPPPIAPSARLAEASAIPEPVRTVDSGWRMPTGEMPAAREPLNIPAPPASRSSVTTAAPPVKHARAQTVALSEDDLEEVREAARLATNPPATQQDHPPAPPRTAAAPSVAPGTRPATSSQPPPMPKITEPPKSSDAEPMSVPEIDIMALEDKAAESGEFEVDVDGIVDAKVADVPAIASQVAPPVAPPAAQTSPGVGDRRSRSSSQPPPTSTTPRESPPIPTVRESQQLPTLRESQQLPVTREAPPPPPPAAHKAPPSPPPAAKKAPPPVVVPPSQKDAKAPRGKPWFVDLFDEDYLRTLPFLTPQATQAEAEFVIDAMGLQPGAQVLDIGCGYGRHAMELAARGMHVVGLDLSTPLLVRGGEEAHRRNLTINFVRGDMRELDFENQFDGAYCLFSTFGYFDDETNKKTVANIARALKPGGRVIIEILNRDYVIADLPTRVWWEGDGCVVLEEVELNYFSSRIQVNRSVVFDDGRQLEQEISVRAYSLHEVGKLMHAAGFRVLEVSGGYHTRGRFFGNQSRHIIVLAERKDATPNT